MKSKYFLFGFTACLFLSIISVIIASKFIERKKERLLILENSKEDKEINYRMVNIDQEEIRNIKLVDEKNTQIVLKKDIVLINFWATWCMPCIAEMPSLKKIETEFMKNSKSIEFFFATSQEQDKVNVFEKKNKFNFKYVFYNPKKISKLFINNSIPVTYIIDVKNNLCYIIDGSINYDSILFKKFINSITF